MRLCQIGLCVKIHPWITTFFHGSQNLINWKYFFSCERILFLFFITFSLVLVSDTKFITQFINLHEVLCFHVYILYPLKLPS